MPAGSEPTVETARNGEPTLRFSGRYLHSRHDPSREAARATSELARRDPPAVVMLGLGLGYHAASILSATAVTRIICYEPSRSIAALALEQGPLAAGVDPDRLLLVDTPDRLEAALPAIAADGFELFELPGRATDSEGFPLARARIRDFTARLDINRNTLNRFGRLWVRNLCRNLPVLATAGSVANLAHAFDGVPALVLAAGPTLDQVLPFLPALADRCVVIAVDTALAPALRAGVRPDFAVVVDPQYWNVRHLDRLVLPDTVLVSEPSAHPHVFRSFPRAVHLCSSVFPLGRAVESRLGRFGPLGAGGSVSTTAWDLARLMGASRVFTAGLDLGFAFGRTHCSGSFFEELALALADRVAPAEATVFRYAWGADAEPVPSDDGGTILSDRRMAIYRAWFASQLAQPHAPQTRSVTSGGSAIPGLAAGSPDDVLSLPCARSRIDIIRRGIVGRDPVDGAGRRDELREWALSAAEQLESLAALAAEASRTLGRIRRDAEQGLPVDFSPLTPIDRAIASHPAGAIGSFLIQHAISRVRQGYGSSSVSEQIDASHGLYEGLRGAAEFHAEKLHAAGNSLVQFSRTTAENEGG